MSFIKNNHVWSVHVSFRICFICLVYVNWGRSSRSSPMARHISIMVICFFMFINKFSIVCCILVLSDFHLKVNASTGDIIGRPQNEKCQGSIVRIRVINVE